MMRELLILGALGLGASTAAAAQEVGYRTERLADGSILAVHHVVVPGPVAEVWRAFTTSEGLMTWAVPFAVVDFRLGGLWESSYDPEGKEGDPANIRNRYLGYVPERMLALQAVAAPPDFPHPEVLPELFTVFEFEAVGDGRTRVTAYGVGYRDTPASNAVREMFADANAWSLRMLHRRFAEGPLDWADVLRGSGG